MENAQLGLVLPRRKNWMGGRKNPVANRLQSSNTFRGIADMGSDNISGQIMSELPSEPTSRKRNSPPTL